MRKIYILKGDGTKGDVYTFIQTSNIKIKKKFDFILRYIADEKNQFKEPYVKHFTIEKYKQFYELRLKVAKTMIRIIFCNVNEDILLLYAFVKRDKRDTEQALEHVLKLIERIDIIDENENNLMDYITEVDVY